MGEPKKTWDPLGGIAIAIEQNTIWQCKGPTFGLCPGSFRAESYGILSALLFLDTYIKHYDTQLDKHTILKFYCNSSSLLKRIARAQNRSWINPTNCLASDYNLESGILDLLEKIPITFNFIHVKSHQDDETEVHLLPWEAQMNVKSDHLASEYLENHAIPSKIIPFIPTSQASLTIQGETITRQFANRLRNAAASSPNIRNRLKLRNQWTKQTFQFINWDAPGKALRTLEHGTQRFIIKFAHTHLPTRQHMRQIGEAKSDKCPACLHTIETHWHIINCKKRNAWRTTLIKDLKDTLQHIDTQPDLFLILVQGIRGALTDPTYQMSDLQSDFWSL
jgi:hypothetical protein